jgi:hypothetical protein
MPMKRPKRSLASNLSALASAAPSSVRKLSRKAVVLDEIACHHRIGHGSGEQLLDEAMPHGIRSARLARSAQGFSEAFRHDVGSHLRVETCSSVFTLICQQLRGQHRRQVGRQIARGVRLDERKSAGSGITTPAMRRSDRHRGWLSSNFVARERQEADHRPYHAEHLGNLG